MMRRPSQQACPRELRAQEPGQPDRCQQERHREARKSAQAARGRDPRAEVEPSRQGAEAQGNGKQGSGGEAEGVSAAHRHARRSAIQQRPEAHASTTPSARDAGEPVSAAEPKLRAATVARVKASVPMSAGPVAQDEAGRAHHAALRGSELPLPERGADLFRFVGRGFVSAWMMARRSKVMPSIPAACPARTMSTHHSDGIDPRRFISEAVDCPTPKVRATAVGPPRASKMSATVFMARNVHVSC